MANTAARDLTFSEAKQARENDGKVRNNDICEQINSKGPKSGEVEGDPGQQAEEEGRGGAANKANALTFERDGVANREVGEAAASAKVRAGVVFLLRYVYRALRWRFVCRAAPST